MKSRCNVVTCSMLLLTVGGAYVAYTIRTTEAMWAARKMWQDFKTQPRLPSASFQRPEMIAIETCHGPTVVTAQTRFAFAAVLTDDPHSVLAAQKLGVSLRQHSQLDMILLTSEPNDDSRLSAWKRCVGDAWKLPDYYDAVLLLDLAIIALRDPSEVFAYKFEGCRLGAVSGKKGVLLLMPNAKPDDDVCEIPMTYNTPATAKPHASTKLLHFTDTKPWAYSLRTHWRRPRDLLSCWGIETLCTLWWLI